MKKMYDPVAYGTYSGADADHYIYVAGYECPSEYEGQFNPNLVIKAKYHGWRVFSITDKAFQNERRSSIYGLVSIHIPKTVETIGESAFEYCQDIKYINIPNVVRIIKESTFSYCFSLTRIRLPDSIRSLETYAFLNCYSLESLNIPDTFFAVGYRCFWYDDNLQHIHVRFGFSDDWFGTVVCIFQSLEFGRH